MIAVVRTGGITMLAIIHGGKTHRWIKKPETSAQSIAFGPNTFWWDDYPGWDTFKAAGDLVTFATGGKW